MEKLMAISPIDGRYRNKVESLENYFSEFALIKYRVLVEIEYFVSLCEIPLPQLDAVPEEKIDAIYAIHDNFTPADAQKIKEIESVTNHDIKAVEYFLKEKFEAIGLGEFKEFIHFGLTSQDINNTAIPLSLRDFLNKEFYPCIKGLVETLNTASESWEEIPMLAHTHGQPASPTRLGKEIFVFVERLSKQIEQLEEIPIPAKFGGATGNFNAHHVAYPTIDWEDFADAFVESDLGGLERSQTTTQIEHYDNLAAIFDAVKRINNILIDLDRDIWTYISMGYFNQKLKKNEVGSSAMPHKINPIDFENSEGNLGVSNAMLEHLAAKLPVSRLQRDLTDSTVLRNLGPMFAYAMIAYQSTLKGFSKLLVNEEKLSKDLSDNCLVVAEAIQTILRREGFPKPYEALKALTRTNEKITMQTIANFIDQLAVSEEIKNELKQITPQNYTGV